VFAVRCSQELLKKWAKKSTFFLTCGRMGKYPTRSSHQWLIWLQVNNSIRAQFGVFDIAPSSDSTLCSQCCGLILGLTLRVSFVTYCLFLELPHWTCHYLFVVLTVATVGQQTLFWLYLWLLLSVCWSFIDHVSYHQAYHRNMTVELLWNSLPIERSFPLISCSCLVFLFDSCSEGTVVSTFSCRCVYCSREPLH